MVFSHCFALLYCGIWKFDGKTMKNYSIVCLSNGFIEHFYLKYKNDYFELLESNTISNLVQTKDEKILKNLIAIN